MSFVPKAQEIYRHFKGNLYQIVAVATHTESGEALVVYQALYGEFKIYARPLSMFTEKVDKEKYPAAAQQYRFERVGCVGGCSAENAPTKKSRTAVGDVQDTLVQEAEAEMVGEEEQQPDPLLLEFLDAKSHVERLNILAALHHRITDGMLFTMSIACDIELSEGTTEEKYEALRQCLMTLDKYEIQRSTR